MALQIKLPFRQQVSAHEVARGLGWFSIGLGLAEIFLPRQLTRTLGMRRQDGLVRAYGTREIVNGIGLLSAKRPAPWLWGRVGGDVLDLATLATGSRPLLSRHRRNARLAYAAFAGITVLDLACAYALSKNGRRRQPRATHDYSNRRGMAKSPEEMRGVAAGSDYKKISTPPGDASRSTSVWSQ
jgi:hypothetical protein